MRTVNSRSATNHRHRLVYLCFVAALLYTLSASVTGATTAHASPSGIPKLLNLVTLTAFVTEDNGADEPYLLISGKKVWNGTLSTPNLGGDYTQQADLSPIGPIPFYDNIEIVLKEEDWPDSDDFLGRNYASADMTDGVLQTAWFTEDGAGYELTYIVTTAAASFVCDGEPGVYLYEHQNYRGRCTRFVQNIPNVSWYDIGNDAVSSIRLVGGYGAVLYEHQNYGGAASAFASSDSDLGNDKIRDNRVTSLTIFR